jgi:hypothetical protein
MLLSTSQASVGKDLAVASKQSNVRGVQLNKFTNARGISTSFVHTGCLGVPSGHCMISCVAQLKRPTEAAKIRKKARRREKRKRCVGRSNYLNPSPPPPPNGTISTSVCLACALRYYAGGSAYDIISSYNISHTELLESVWYVVDAINQTALFDISYP